MHHDCTSTCSRHRSGGKCDSCGLQSLLRHPYSPDLAPYDYHIIGPLEALYIISSDDDVKETVQTWIQEQSKHVFSEEMKKPVK